MVLYVPMQGSSVIIVGKTRGARASATRARAQCNGARARNRKEFLAKELVCGNTQNLNLLFDQTLSEGLRARVGARAH
jgi:hypothetical protein